MFERLIHKQISFYNDQFLSHYMCDDIKKFSTQEALSVLLKNGKKLSCNKGYGRTVLMDLLKAFDTIIHDLLIVKLHVYRFSKELLKLISSYLTNR